MPRIPTYEGPQVREAALPGVVQRTPDVSSDAVMFARGLGAAAEALDRIDLQRAQAEADKADAEIGSQWLRWDAENRSKFQGENAARYVEAAEEWWAKARQEYGRDLDPRARSLAGRSLERKYQSSIADAARFAAAETERHQAEVFKAALQTDVQVGISTGNVAAAAQSIKDRVARFGAARGWKTEQVLAEQQRSLSALHTAQIAKLLTSPGGATAAREYYGQVKAEVDGAAQPRIEEILAREELNQKAQERAAALAGLPLDEQIKRAGEEKDPELRSRIILEVKNNHALVQQARREQEERASDTAWQMYSRGERIPEAILAQMDGRERAQLADAQRARADRLARGAGEEKIKTDWPTYLDLREKIAAGDIKRPTQLIAYAEKLAPKEREALADLIDAQAKLGVKDVVTFEQQVGAFVKELNLTGEREGKFRARAQELVMEHQKRTGKPPTDQERAELLRWLAGKEVIERPWWLPNSETARYQLPRDDVLRKAPIAGSPAAGPVSVPFEIGKVYTDKTGARAIFGGVDAAGNLIWNPAP